ALWLAQDGLVDGAAQQHLVSTGAQRCAQIGGVVLTEAHVKGPRAGQPYAIATLAEVVRHRRYKAQSAAGLLDAHIAGGTAGAEWYVLERPTFEQPGAHDREGQVLFRAVAVDVAHRHGLDQGQIETAAMCETNEIVDFVLIYALERHGIELDGKAG